MMSLVVSANDIHLEQKFLLYGEISAKKIKLMTNSANGIQREIKVKEQKLCTVTSFKYLGEVSDDGSIPEVLKDCTSH